mmetsp:Transcript_72601/g.200288  ORF Transcript_72601/g.200288 Transcript_72601/m.200288 type:complete len:272 (+) Transcript_72601:119-934(+)
MRLAGNRGASAAEEETLWRLGITVAEVLQALLESRFQLGEVRPLGAQQLSKLAGNTAELTAMLLLHCLQRLLHGLVVDPAAQTARPNAPEVQSAHGRFCCRANVLLLVAEHGLQRLGERACVGLVASLDDCLTDAPQVGPVCKHVLRDEARLHGVREQPALVQELGGVVHAVLHGQEEAKLLQGELEQAAAAAVVGGLHGALQGGDRGFPRQLRDLLHGGLQSCLPKLSCCHEAPHHFHENDIEARDRDQGTESSNNAEEQGLAGIVRRID